MKRTIVSSTPVGKENLLRTTLFLKKKMQVNKMFREYFRTSRRVQSGIADHFKLWVRDMTDETQSKSPCRLACRPHHT